MASYQGSCLCGDIVFEASQFQPLAGHCHCNMCQKFHGAAFSTFVEVSTDHLRWIKGESLLSHYQAENESRRSFCKQCGSSLLFESKYNRQAKTVEIALASFDSSIDINPDAHIYTSSKVSWFSINDQLPQFESYREEK